MTRDELIERRIWKLLAESVEGEHDGTTIPVPVEDIRRLLTAREEAHAPTSDEREALADDLARRLIDDPKHLMLAEGTGALHVALSESIRATIEDVYADCGDSDPGVLSSNIARRLAGDLPSAILAAGFRRSEVPEPSGPWDSATACFGHCDKEGWYSECVSKKADAEMSEPSAERLMQAPAIQAVREVLDQVSDRMDEHAYSEISSALEDIPDCESATAMPHAEHAEPQGEPSDAQLDAACAEIAARMNYKVQPTRGTMRAALRAARGAGGER